MSEEKNEKDIVFPRRVEASDRLRNKPGYNEEKWKEKRVKDQKKAAEARRREAYLKKYYTKYSVPRLKGKKKKYVKNRKGKTVVYHSNQRLRDRVKQVSKKMDNIRYDCRDFDSSFRGKSPDMVRFPKMNRMKIPRMNMNSKNMKRWSNRLNKIKWRI